MRAGGRLVQQRQERLGHRDHAEHVGVEGLAPGGERLLRRLALGVVAGDAGVVDQDVEPAVLAGDLVGRGGDAVGVGHVERDGFDRQAFGLQLQRGFDGLAAVAPASSTWTPVAASWRDGFEADAAGGAGDERDPGSVCVDGHGGVLLGSDWVQACTACAGRVDSPCLTSGRPDQLAQGDVEHRGQEQAEQGHAEHAGEHGDAGDRAHFRAGAVREHQRHGAGDERDRGHHDRAQAQAAGFQRGFDDALALHFQLAGELDDQDRVLARQAHQHHQADLHEHVVVAAGQPHAGQRREHAHRHDQDHRQRQRPAFVQRGQHQEREQDRQREHHQRGVALGGLLVAQVGPLDAHAVGQHLGRQFARAVAIACAEDSMRGSASPARSAAG